MVIDVLGDSAPDRCTSRGPRAVVGFHPFVVFVVVTAAWLEGAPVDFGDDDGVGVHHGNLIVELGDFPLGGGLYIVGREVLVVAAVPAVVVVHCIAEVDILDGEGGVVGIAGLPSCSWHPDDALEAVLANLVDHGLEEVAQGRLVAGAVGIFHAYGFIGQLDADLSWIATNGVVLGEDIPDCSQIFLIVVVHANLTRAHSGRTHNDVKPMSHGFLHEREIERFQVSLQARLAEMRDIGFAAYLMPQRVVGLAVFLGETFGCDVAVVGPRGFQMQAEHRAMCLLESREKFLEIVQAALATGVVVAPAPAAVVEPRTRGVHHSVKHHMIAVGVHQPTTLHMD